MDDKSMSHDEYLRPHRQAIISHGLMLLNLLFPVLIYLFLVVYWLKHRKSEDRLLYVAINQAFIAATISTLLFILANVLILIFAQYKSTFALITFEIYFVFVVPIFLIPGLMGLVKSNAHLIYYYPLLGRKFKTV
ncbi:MAG: hypothetical protein R3E90_10340 [Marinicella sp.]|nr:hypothetical protein [Xanthomonadales bacterium]